MAAEKVKRAVHDPIHGGQRGLREIGDFGLVEGQGVAVAIARGVGRHDAPPSRGQRLHQRLDLFRRSGRGVDQHQRHARFWPAEPIVDLPAGQVGKAAADPVRHASALFSKRLPSR